MAKKKKKYLYKLVVDSWLSKDSFEEEVNSLLDEGWNLYGFLKIDESEGMIYQALIIEDDLDED